MRIVDEKTGGNPFFAIQFLHELAEEALLAFDHAETALVLGFGPHPRETLHRQRGRSHGRQAGPLAGRRRWRRSASSPASASSAEFALLATVCRDLSRKRLHERLWEAVRAGLVIRSEIAYAFQHDRIQEAAYSLIPEAERAAAHLRIGRLLLEHTPPDRREEIVFEIVSHFNRSAALITAPDERDGGGAAQSDRRPARQERRRLCLGADLFRRGSRTADREIAGRCNTHSPSQLELHRAECEFLTGETESARTSDCRCWRAARQISSIRPPSPACT